MKTAPHKLQIRKSLENYADAITREMQDFIHNPQTQEEKDFNAFILDNVSEIKSTMSELRAELSK